MTQYDKQYQVESNLFGPPYPEFELFVKQHAKQGGRALDLGCGQGRDALMLAKHGYTVTGVDSSQVGIAQMVARAKQDNLAVEGIVADLYAYAPHGPFDAIVLDSILHFAKADTHKELALLDTVARHVDANGFLFLFVHKSAQKEKVLKAWFKKMGADFKIVQEDYIDYVYEETVTSFRSAFQYYMLILKRIDTA